MLLALDRTCWKFGRYDINVLILAIIHNGIAIRCCGTFSALRELKPQGAAERPSCPGSAPSLASTAMLDLLADGSYRQGLDDIPC